MENKRSEFKKLLEKTVIPEVMSYEEREPLLKPLLEYVHSIIPQNYLDIVIVLRPNLMLFTMIEYMQVMLKNLMIHMIVLSGMINNIYMIL